MGDIRTHKAVGVWTLEEGGPFAKGNWKVLCNSNIYYIKMGSGEKPAATIHWKNVECKRCLKKKVIQ